MVIKYSYALVKKTFIFLAFCISIMFGLMAISPYLISQTFEWLNSKSGEKFILGFLPDTVSIGAFDLNWPNDITASDINVTLSPAQKVHIKSVRIDIADPVEGVLSLSLKGLHTALAPQQNVDVRTLDLKMSSYFIGTLSADARALEYDIKLNSDFIYEKNKLQLQKLSLQAPKVKLAGEVLINAISKSAKGTLHGTIGSLKPYVRFIGLGHDVGVINIGTNFDVSATHQKADLIIKTSYYKNSLLGLALQDIDLETRLNDQTLKVTSLQANDGDGGIINLSGDYNLAKNSLDFALKANTMHIPKGEPVDALFNADVTVKGTLDALNVAGVIDMSKLNITLPKKFTDSIDELNIEEEGAKGNDGAIPILLDLKLNAPSKVFIRGWGLDAEFGGNSKIKGRSDAPEIYGDFEIIRGRFEEFGRKFTLPKAILSFEGPVPPSPSIDITAEYDTGDMITQILMSGSANDPEISFASQPSLPEDEVMAQILFGSSMNNLSPFQIVQLTQTLARFTGQGGSATTFDPLGAIREGVGLDDLKVGMDEDGSATVGAGKYIADGVYLELEGGSGKNSSGASVEIELAPHITLESKIGQNASGGAGIFFEWDY